MPEDTSENILTDVYSGTGIQSQPDPSLPESAGIHGLLLLMTSLARMEDSASVVRVIVNSLPQALGIDGCFFNWEVPPARTDELIVDGEVTRRRLGISGGLTREIINAVHLQGLVTLGDNGQASIVMIPVATGRDRLGLLGVVSRIPLNESRTLLLRAAAGFLALMLDNARLHTDTDRRTRELEDLIQKRTAELQGVEHQYRMLFEGISDAAFVIDSDGRFMDVNHETVRRLGYSREELLGMKVEDILAPEERPALSERLSNLIQRKRARFESCYVSRKGLRTPVEVNIRWIDSNGIKVALAVARDISMRQSAAEAMERQRLFFERVTDSIDEAITVLDSDLIITHLNEGFLRNARRMGHAVNRQDRVGRPLQEFTDPAHWPEMQAGIREVMSTRKSKTLPEQTFKDNDGKSHVFSCHLHPLLMNGHVEGAVIVRRDETAQHNLEAQLRHSQKMETIGTLTGGIAHDFNNQLTAILGHLGLILMDMGRDNPHYKRLTEVEQATQRCAEMTQGMLAFSRRVSGEPRPVNLNGIIDETTRLLERALPATIDLRVNRAPDLWVTEVDATQIQQVLMNLCVNARDAMPDGGILTVESLNRELDEEYCSRNIESRPGRFVTLSVSDTGMGMDAATKSRIFEPFFTTKGPGKGTGLGLSMVYGIVKAHKGWISVYTEPGSGSRFLIYLPAVEMSTVETVKERPAPRGGNETLLIADDEPIVVDLTRAILERSGYKVLSASDGLEALELFKSHAGEISAVLLDLTMPRMTGRQALDQIRTLDPKMKVILSSGYAIDRDTPGMELSGAQGFIQKPYQPVQLIKIVREVLDE